VKEGFILSSAIFLKKIGSRMHSDLKFSRRGGGVSYINAREKKILERYSGLRPLKELPEQCSSKFSNKNTHIEYPGVCIPDSFWERQKKVHSNESFSY
jgi:hypothetical protein